MKMEGEAAGCYKGTKVQGVFVKKTPRILFFELIAEGACIG
jgi:hypothetical protein